MHTQAKSHHSAGPSRRQRKVNSLLQEQVGSMLRRLTLPSSDSLVTVTSVQVTADLKEAKVWISVLGGNEQQVLRVIQQELPKIQSEIYHTLSMRPVPKLEFVLDTSQEFAARIDHAIRSLHEHN